MIAIRYWIRKMQARVFAGDYGSALDAVSDSGIGIASDQADRIFDAFFTTKPRGSGMGLSISRTIVESHGGRLWASANTTRGTTFQFTLRAT
jgi:signal transduction histidine kinase